MDPVLLLAAVDLLVLVGTHLNCGRQMTMISAIMTRTTKVTNLAKHENATL